MNKKMIARELVKIAKSIVANIDDVRYFQDNLVEFALYNGVPMIRLEGYGYVDLDFAKEILERREKEKKGIEEALEYAKKYTR